jgi:hypothetical protein
MIDYELLCQTIEDWRAGRRPSIDLSATPVGAGAADDYAEVDPDQHYEGGYDQGQYADPNQAYEGGYEGSYESYEYGAPAQVPGSGTSPMEVSEVEDYEQ